MRTTSRLGKKSNEHSALTLQRSDHLRFFRINRLRNLSTHQSARHGSLRRQMLRLLCSGNDHRELGDVGDQTLASELLSF